MARSAGFVAVAVGLAALAGLGAQVWGTPAAAEPVGGPPGQNDAGSGQDAGDAPFNALLIPGARRTWNANLTPPGLDADWYRLGASSAFCAVASVTTSAEGSLTLAASPDRDPAVDRAASPHKATRLVLAAPAGHAPFLGIEPAPSLMAAGSGVGNPTPSPGRYAFSLASLTPHELDPEGDGERPDAGATSSTAAPLPPECAAGRLDGAAGDVEDRYYFDVTEPREVTLSFAVAAGDPAEARVLTPSGATYATLASGGAAHVWASEPGRWSVAVTVPGATAGPARLAALAPLVAVPTTLTSSYLLGTTDGPGDREPCRPSCLLG